VRARTRTRSPCRTRTGGDFSRSQIRSPKAESAEFLAGILGIPAGTPNGPFLPVRLTNRVTLDFADAESVHGQHLAFLVSEKRIRHGFRPAARREHRPLR
jgi:hypothetical protein